MFKPIRYSKTSITIYADASIEGCVPPWVMYPQVWHGVQMRI